MTPEPLPAAHMQCAAGWFAVIGAGKLDDREFGDKIIEVHRFAGWMYKPLVCWIFHTRDDGFYDCDGLVLHPDNNHFIKAKDYPGFTGYKHKDGIQFKPTPDALLDPHEKVGAG